MKKQIFNGLASLLLPFGAYASASVSNVYQRNYLRSQSTSGQLLNRQYYAADMVDRGQRVTNTDELLLSQGTAVRELVIIDEAVPDKSTLYKALRRGVDVVEISSEKEGLQQLVDALKNYHELHSLHIVSHANNGEVLLGNSRVTIEAIKHRVDFFNAINGTIKENGDLLFYGCNLAEDSEGETLLELITAETHVDVATSNDPTGDAEQGGDWELEVTRGNIETELAFSEKALKDFTGTLAINDGVGKVITTGGFPGGYGNFKTYDVDATGHVIRLSTSSVNSSAIYCGFGYCSVNFGGGLTDTESLYIDFSGGETFDIDSIAAYSPAGNNTYVFTPSSGIAVTGSGFDSGFSTQALNFTNITRLTITRQDGNDLNGFDIDNLVIKNVSSSNAAPVISNIDGDSVAWAGVGNTVNLDSGGDATVSDTEFDALNGGNGDYSGGSLTIQRPTALTSDVFGFNTSGASFTVNGSDLQNGGQTFASFTNTNGVMTITFNSSATTATKALVQDIARRITYRSDSPAGDATVRFTLSDGTDNDTADVTVTSDSLYVTDTTDTASIDASDGVSFSEAIAIAAADGTGTQTIVIDSSLAGQTVSATSTSSLTESLTLDLGEATGVTISGGSLSISGGSTLTLDNDTGDTASISTAFGGTGAITKTGGGTVTLTASQSYSGVTTFSGGTISVAGDSNLGSGQLIINGGTLSATSSGTINNAINVAASGTFNHSTNMVLSGLISGSNTLTISGSGELQFTNTGNEANSSVSLTITSGTVWTNNDNVFPSGTITLDGGNFASNGSSGTSTTVDNNFVMGPSGGSFDIYGGGGNYSLILSGVISGSGNLTKTVSANLELTGTNTWSGTTTIQAGQIIVAGDSNLGTGNIVFSNGTLNVTGNGVTIDNNIVMSSGGTVSNANDITLSGTVSGSGTLTKTGAGTLSLSGTQTQTGGTNVTAGGVNIAGDSNIGSGTVTLNGGNLTITGTGTIDNSISIGSSNGTITNSNSVTLSGVVSGTGSPTKAGVGALFLTGTNTNTGLLNISAGTLSNTGTVSSLVTVSSGATLEGAGVFSSPVVINSGGTVQLGSSPGTMTLVSGFTLNPGGTLVTRINGNVAGTSYDQYNVSGTVSLGGTLSVIGTHTGAGGESYNIINNDASDSVSSTFNGLAEGNQSTTLNSIPLAISYVGGSGNDVVLSPVGPTLTDANISIAGASGTGGAYKIGDTITATWDDTGSGDNNGDITSVTFDFSGFGGGSSVTASNSANVWTAAYTITSGAIDGTNFNVSATATNSSAISTTTADTTNATLDNIAPIVTDSNISISGASGSGGAFKIGDTLTATWNNTAGGDNNSDTITSAAVDFSAFGGGAAVSASNFSGTWTATYTIVSGAIDSTNLNVSVTATDNAGNTTTAADSSNATVDNVSPTVTDGNISISGATGSGGAYKIGDTVTATWNNTAGGDSNSDSISSATVDFSAFGGGAAASATNSSDTWSATYTIVAGAVDGTNLNVSFTAIDNAGNSTSTVDTTNAAVDNIAPTMIDANISISGGSGTGGAYILGDTITATWDNTGSGDNNSDLITAVTVDFSAFGGGGAVSASNSSSTWTATYTLTTDATSASNLNVAMTSVDDAGNSTTTADTSNATVDVDAPAVSDVTSSTPNAIYKVGDTVAVDVVFSSAVDVTGSPTIELETGTTDRTAIYDSGTGTATLTFNYTVQAGDIAADLDYTSTNALSLNGGTISDTSGNAATLTLASPAASNSLGANKAIVIDTTAPTLASVTVVTTPTTDSTPNFTFSTNEVGTISIGGNCGTSTSTTISATGNQTITLTDTDSFSALSDATYTDCTVTVTDSAGNASSALSIASFVVDTTGPSNSTNTGLTVNEAASVVVSNAALASNDASSSATAVTYVLSSVPANGSLTLNSSALSVSNTFTQDDIDNNRVSYTHDGSETTSDSFGFDLRDALNNTNNNGGAHIGVTITVNAVNDDPTDISVTSTSVSQSAGTNAVVGTLSTTDLDAGDTFTYTFVAGTGDTHNGSFNISGNQLRAKDAGSLSPGNYSVRIQTTDSGTATFSKAFTISVVDDVNAIVNSVSVPTDNTYGVGNALTFVVNYSENVTVDIGGGTPSIALSIGSQTRYADYVSGSETSALTFRYIVVESDEDTDGISIAASIDTNGGTIEDDANLTANTTLNGVGSLTAVLVDGILPGLAEVTAVSTPTNDTTPDVIITSDQDGTVSIGGSCGTNSETNISAGSVTLTLTQTDNTSALVEGTYSDCTVTVTDTNDNPSEPLALSAFVVDTTVPNVSTNSTLTLDEGATALVSNTELSTTDVITTAATNLVYTVTALPENGALQLSSGDLAVNSTFTQDDIDNDLIAYIHNAGESTSDSFEFTVADEAGNVAQDGGNSFVFDFAITAQNDAPVITEGESVTVNISEDNNPVAFNLTLNATDVDLPGDTLTWSIATAANVGTASVSGTGNSQAINYTPQANYNGGDSFVVQVSDGTVTDTIMVNLNIAAVNDAPAITGTPASSVNEDSAYSFTPTGVDLENDALTYSIANKPSWASFDTTTGALTGTPINDNVGVTTGIIVSVSDAEFTTNLAAFDLTVVNTNDAPTISGTPVTTVDEDALYTFTATASDVDVGDSLTFSVANAPSWLSINATSGVLSGTPANDDVGTASNIIVSVGDGTTSVSLTAFAITVVNTNDAPTISGTPSLLAPVGGSYQFTPTATDVDVGDSLTFSATGLPTWLSVDPATGELSGTPVDGDIGSSTITLSVSDGTASASLTAFTLAVVSAVDTDGDGVPDYQEEIDGTDPNDPEEYVDVIGPVVTAPENITLDATALFTPVTAKILLGLQANASSALVLEAKKALATDNTEGEACCESVLVNAVADKLFLAPGRNQVTWRATDAKGNSGEGTQFVDVRPLVSFGKDRISAEGATVKMRILLNGKSPDYPLEIPYSIDTASTAGSQDHNLVDGVATLAQGETEAVINIQIASDAETESNEQLVVHLDDEVINTGVKSSYTLTIVETNVAPEVTLLLEQNGNPTVLVSPSEGDVTVTAIVDDANVGDAHTFDWSASDNRLIDKDGSLTDMGMVFDPSDLIAGIAKIRVTVNDGHGGIDKAKLTFRVVSELPTLESSNDSDNDGVDDVAEGTGDMDDDGIPDYLDNIVATNVLPESVNSSDSFLIECDPGVRCRLGEFALISNSGGAHLPDEDQAELLQIPEDVNYEHVGGLFDFEVEDLPIAGQSVQVVIPQLEVVPMKAVYRKLMNGQWTDFVEDASNQIHSTRGAEGFCPPPGDASWEPGLIAGNYCVQLTIQDGGPNDADGEENGTVEDPGVVAQPIEEEVVEVTHIRSTGSGGGSSNGGFLLLLGLLAFTTRLREKFRHHAASIVGLLFVTGAFGVSQTSHAQEVSVRFGVDYAFGSEGRGDMRSAIDDHVESVSISNYDNSRLAYRLSLEMELPTDGALKGSALALSYIDLGDVSVDMDAQITQELEFAEAIEDTYPITGDGVALSYLYNYSINDKFTAAFELGLFYWDGDIDLSGANLPNNYQDGVDPFFGAHVQYILNDRWSAGFDLMHYSLDDQTVTSLGGSVRFRLK
ncbi:Adhesin BmaC autotransporter [Thalassocella blandensis]|nr:Adhesin BmaC autotransporter [Thalassocella blandensis]